MEMGSRSSLLRSEDDSEDSSVKECGADDTVCGERRTVTIEIGDRPEARQRLFYQ